MADDPGRAIEAILMVADTPIEPQILAQLLELPVSRIDELCAELAATYDASGRGFVLLQVAGGYRFQSHPDLAPYVERFVLEGQSARLSSAALETLAIVAYKQPVSRAQVAAIRGVNVDGVMRTLQQRSFIDEIGRDPGPGQAVLYGTSATFLERLGLNSVDDLPPLGQFVPGAEVVEALEIGLRPEPFDLPADPVDEHPADDDIAEEQAADDEPIAGGTPVADEPPADRADGSAPDGA